MADNRRPSSVPSEDFYKTRMANSSNISRKSSMQAGTETSQIVCADRSLFIFSKENFIRKICRTIVESKPFEYFILLTIFVNCILLAANTPLPNNDKSDLNQKLEDAEVYLLAIFCLEAVLKIIALGFVLHADSYLRNGWNVLDFVVVVTGLLSLPQLNVFNAGSLKALRAARVLRPLKLVSGIPSLQVVMKSIMCAMVPLLQICLLVGFVIIIYAIIGLEFLVGRFHYVCNQNVTGRMEITDPDGPQICVAKGTGTRCPEGQFCLKNWEGPNDGITSFDNIFAGMLTVFQVITNEGWTDIMYWTFDAYDAHGYVFWIYYYSLVVIGSFFMLNLVLGVLSGEFAKERERVENRRAFLKVRRTQKMERHLHGYIDWISKAEDLMLEEEEEEDGNVDVSRRRNLDRVEDGDVAMTSVVLTGQSGRRHRLNTGKKKSFCQRFLRRNKRWKIRVRQAVKHQAFYWTVLICVFLNTVITALQYYNQPAWLTQFQDVAEIVFISFFFCEMMLKLYGLGPQLYFKSQFNTFDCLVVSCGIIELIISKAEGTSLGISVLRALRLLRLFKFTRYWSSLRNLVTSLLSSVRSILSLLFLLFLFIVIFALLGMQLFGAEFRDLPGRNGNPRTNFDNFWNAALAVFQILTGEDWNAVMYEGVLSQGYPEKSWTLVWCLYFVLLVVLGNYTLLNVFLAIAVDNLANAQQLSQDEEAEENAREERRREIADQYRDYGSPRSSPGRNGDARRGMGDEAGPTEDEFEEEADDGKPSFLSNLRNPGRMVPHQKPGEAVPMIDTWSLFLFPPGNPVRKACHWLVNLRHFDNFILVIILISSVLLALEDPVDEESKRNEVLTYFDYVFTTVFAMEVLVKLIDYGAILHPGSYFRDAWNCIDALVVSCAIASLVMGNQDQSTIDPGSKKTVKVLRVLRVLRPLKAINKAKKLKAVFQCMVYSLKNVLNILIITILFLFIFSVIGVQLFQGKFFKCDDPSKMTKEECQGQYFSYPDLSDLSNVEIKERSWEGQEYNFDNVFYAMLSLFTSSTGEGWPALMQASIDTTAVDRGPIVDNKIEIALFYIFFVVVFSFFFINIFVALIILTFQEQGEKDQGDCELDRNQRDCLHFAIVAKPSERFMPQDPNTWQYRIWRIVDSSPFEFFIMILIALNTLILTMKFDDEPPLYREILDLFNTIFTFMFTGEAILKLFAFRTNYFRDSWNVFDFIIVLGSLLDFALSRIQSDESDSMPFDPSLFRLFRAARLIKLLRQGYTIRILLWTFLQSFKALPYVGMLIGLLFFIYAVIGMQMFGQITIDNAERGEPWDQIASRNNFQSFPEAIQVLFRSATGENWQLIMLACTADADCQDKEGKCGSAFAYLYFISFIFFCSFLLLNLFVAVIMDNFEYLTRDESILGPHHLDEFVRVWSEFDPGATGRIKHTEVCQLLRQMSPPIGIGKKCPKIVAYKRLIKMNMPLFPDNTVTFTATLFALVRTSLKIMTEKNNLKENDKELRAMLKRVWPKLTKKTLDRVVPKPPSLINNGKSNQVNQQPQMTVGKIYCAKLIYENYKFMRRKGQAQSRGTVLSRFVGGPAFQKFRRDNDPELGEGVPMQDVAISLADGPYHSGSAQALYHPNHQQMDSPSRSRYRQNTPVAHRSTTSLNEGRGPGVTTALVGPHRRQLPQTPGSRTGSQLSLTGKAPALPENRGDSVLENGYHPNMNQHIAMAIRSGQSPYAIYGLEEMGDEDDWC
ncbi:voltage-dependent R-type calcium channel subunit alpha-1E-like isoform X3 [Orbicella faveolata]|uniref:voltage-dependent R-type calcium channel subunit alpha-1E-like isoform X3 n=1 Tax=Orbicella faveolata TaxID=48498 RepID=UPI0009E4528A|nr:voltage-dependent R-type calcium channel subunit alpha-1E-like isoform X3 [Orbicella faveolata]